MATSTIQRLVAVHVSPRGKRRTTSRPLLPVSLHGMAGARFSTGGVQELIDDPAVGHAMALAALRAKADQLALERLTEREVSHSDHQG